jgi:mono/diheme cytochrome c family protein
MRTSPRVLLSVPLPVLLLLAAASCGAPPSPGATETEVASAAPRPTTGGVSAASPTGVLPLVEIMRRLEADLADVAHGIWVEDPGTVRDAAGRIAAHPRVPPEQMATIRSTLGDELAAFAAMDGSVHDASVALAEAAEAGAATAELFAGYQRIQEGCLGCHAAFRARVFEALRGAEAQAP